jgi:hypothetical protein
MNFADHEKKKNWKEDKSPRDYGKREARRLLRQPHILTECTLWEEMSIRLMDPLRMELSQ